MMATTSRSMRCKALSEAVSLAPFLYHTATILQGPSTARHAIRHFSAANAHAVRPSASRDQRGPIKTQKACLASKVQPIFGGRDRDQRKIRSRNRDGEVLPFRQPEDIQGRGLVNDVSSVTASEARIFQGLLTLQKKPIQQANKQDNDSGEPDLNTVVSNAIGVGLPSIETTRIVQDYLERQKELDQERPARLSDQDKSGGQLRRLKALMEEAPTDLRLWQILHAELLDKVMALNLDSGSKKVVDVQAKAELVRMFQPTVTLFYETMRANFPTSSYALTLLPYLRQLSPSVWAIAASTELYNHHLRLLYRQRIDLPAMLTTLDEMDANVIPFDARTLQIILTVFRHLSAVQQQEKEDAMTLFWATEQTKRNLQSLLRWRWHITHTLQDEALHSSRSNDERQTPISWPSRKRSLEDDLPQELHMAE